MNDRFKFRIWDKEQNKYLPLVSRGDDIDFWISLDNTGVYLVERDNNRDVAYFNDITEDVIVQFCTGLKDKNGKLIYEGDFLKDDENMLYEVTFKLQKYATSFSLKRREIPDYYPHITTWCGLGYRNCNKYEVIGNIYENPELLEDTECQK